MSRSDNTDKLGLTGLEHKWQTWSFHRGTGRDLRRRWQKRQRQRERAALHAGREPEPIRTRGSVKYDYW